MILFTNEGGIKHCFDSVMIREIQNELKRIQSDPHAVLYSASGFDVIEFVGCILYSLDFIDKDLSFSIVDALKEIRRERDRAWDKINGAEDEE